MTGQIYDYTHKHNLFLFIYLNTDSKLIELQSVTLFWVHINKSEIAVEIITRQMTIEICNIEIKYFYHIYTNLYILIFFFFGLISEK